jgi:hypothetical protein
MLSAPDEYKPSAPTCVIDAIRLSDVLIWGKHFLVRDKNPWVERYVVYQSSDSSATLDQMRKVWETSENKFEFSFDEDAKEPMYNYFSVQWICSDSQTTNVHGTTKVQVWPRNIALYIAMIFWFCYTGIILVRKVEQE